MSLRQVFFLVLISLSSVLCAAFSNIKLNPSVKSNLIHNVVLEGQKVAPGSSIWQSSVYMSIKDFHCSGVILHKRVVLTAAHCVQNIEADDVKVFFGFSSDQYFFQKTSVKVKKIIFKPEYNYLTRPELLENGEPLAGYLMYSFVEYYDTQSGLEEQSGVQVYNFPFPYKELLQSFENRHEPKTQESLYSLGHSLNLSSGYDVALLFLKDEIPDGYKPAELLPNERLESEISKHINVSFPKFLITGYGLEQRLIDEYVPDLRSHPNDLINSMKLENKYFVMLFDSRLSPEVGRGCYGDSGGGIYYVYNNKHYLVGLMSAGYNECAGLTVSPSLNFHRDWINKNINLELDSLGWDL